MPLGWKLDKVLLLSFVLIPTIFSSKNIVTRAETTSLYDNFRNPDRSYTVQPYWFWNGKLVPEQIEHQLEEMAKQGVYAVNMMPMDGMFTPYLSEEYWRGVEVALKAARRLGMQFNFNDEYNWPSGHARDVWIDNPVQSRVLLANPEYHMRSLVYEEFDFYGPQHVMIPLPYKIELAVACQMTGPLTVDPKSLRLLSELSHKNRIEWDVPTGRWRIVAYHLEESISADGGEVDPMNPDAIRKFIELVYEKYYERFAEYFGTTIRTTMADTEGSYGYGLAWTPKLFDEFQRRKRYDIRKYLPVLMYDGGKITDKIRCDFLDVVSQLYAETFGGMVTRWCEDHGIQHYGSFWEESLLYEAAYEGDFFQIYRAVSLPEIDALFDTGRLPITFKSAASIAHYRGTKIMIENQGLQGIDSYISPEKMRSVTNMIANWGMNIFTPYFDLDQRKIWWPPQWFLQQPFWPYFHHYADYVRRISYMNTGGQHIAPIVVFHNVESVWANSSPVFDVPRRPAGFPRVFGNIADEINRVWQQIQLELASQGWDYDVMDHYYLNEAKIDTGQLRLANESYSVLILPPMVTVRRSSLEKMAKFFDSGGTIIAVGQLPANSMDEGRNDAKVSALVAHIFGSAHPPYNQINKNAAGGKAVLVKQVEEIFPLLENLLTKDVQVLKGDPDHFFYLHRKKLGQDFYWVVNDSEHPREMMVRFNVVGVPEKWDAESGQKSPLFYTNRKDSTVVRLRFDPWDAFYVVFYPLSPEKKQSFELIDTNVIDFKIVSKDPQQIVLTTRVPMGDDAFYVVLAEDNQLYRGDFRPSAQLTPIVLSGSWRFTPQSKIVRAAYAKVQLERADEGKELGWAEHGYRDDFWAEAWLAAERFTPRKWWVIGPFPNKLHQGFWQSYAPEKEIDLTATYEGLEGPVRWRELISNIPHIELDPLLSTENQRWAVAYAFSYIYSPRERKVKIHATAPNLRVFLNGKQILANHYFPHYFEVRQAWTEPVEATLIQGWNSVLVKVEKDRGQGWIPGFPRVLISPGLSFYFRVTDEQGNNIPELVYNNRKILEAPIRTDGLGVSIPGQWIYAGVKEAAPILQGGKPPMVWYRLAIPPGVTAVHLPRLSHPYETYVNGLLVHPDSNGRLVLTSLHKDGSDVLALRVSYSDEIPDYIVFDTGTTDFNLMSLTLTGLQNYSGLMDYEKDFELPASYIGKRLILDLGRVGVAAEVWLNGQKVGERVWRPFSFDITGIAKAGTNHVRIRVANSDSNGRWEAQWRSVLQGKLDLNGLIGPVRVLPYEEVKIICQKQ